MGPLITVENYLNDTACLILTDQVHPFMARVSPSSNGQFQQDHMQKADSTNMTVSSVYSNGLHGHQIAIVWDVVERERFAA